MLSCLGGREDICCFGAGRRFCEILCAKKCTSVVPGVSWGTLVVADCEVYMWLGVSCDIGWLCSVSVAGGELWYWLTVQCICGWGVSCDKFKSAGPLVIYAVAAWNLGKPLSFLLKTEENQTNRCQDGRAAAWRTKIKKKLQNYPNISWTVELLLG